MDTAFVDYIGYAASTVIIVSFLLKNLRHLRVVNLVGCILFILYGSLGAKVFWPVVIPNAVIGLVQVYHLIKRT